MSIDEIAQQSGRSNKLIAKIANRLGLHKENFTTEESELILSHAVRKRETLALRVKEAIMNIGPMTMYQLKEVLGVTYAHVLWAVTEMTYDSKYRGLYETDDGVLNFWTREEQEEFRDILGDW